MPGWLDKLIHPSRATQQGPADTAARPSHREQAALFKDRGNEHLARGEIEAALHSYEEALAIDPEYAEAHNNLGLVWIELGRTEDARKCFERALALKPALVQAHVNLANVLRSEGQFPEAIVAFRSAITLDPASAEAHNDLGALLQTLGRLEQAAASFRRAINLRPTFVQARYNLGNVYQEQGLLDQAQRCLREALELKPDFPEAWNSLGIVSLELRDLDDAEHCFRMALNAQGTFPAAHNNLGTLALHRGKRSEAYAEFEKALDVDPGYVEAHSNLLFAAQYDPDCSPADLLAKHLRFGELHEQPLRGCWPIHANTRDPARRLRIGFVSGDFRSHPVGFFLENVLTHLDRGQLDIVLYPTLQKRDAVTERLNALADSWCPLQGLSDAQAAERIANDAIDILVDLSGHTAENRLLVFARKPAPIQVSWLYFSSTGLACFDYILCDRYVLPESEAGFFVEKPWYLPDAYLCFTPPDDDIPIKPPPALGCGHPTFGCFNNLLKLNEDVVRLWSRILLAIPSAKLLLKASQMDDEAMRTIRARFAAHDVAPDRLVLEGPSRRTEYLGRYNDVDIVLDPFPFPGGTTSVEALWMSVPVLTRAGNRFISHAGESILHAAGLPEWIAKDDADYIAKAVAFASDLPALAALRAELRGRFLASPLCDGARFARGLESAWRAMWQTYCSLGARQSGPRSK